MKLRRILAGVLAFAMVITASPLENVSFAAESTQTISAVDTAYVHWSANMKTTTESGINKLACQNQGATGGLRADMPSIKTLQRDVLGNFNEKNQTWPWFAYRISVKESGTYTLGSKINGCGSSTLTIPIYVDEKVYTLTFDSDNAEKTTKVELSAGEHIVVMFSPMPEQLDDTIVGNGIYYPWCNFESIIVDSRLTVVEKTEKALADADVVACFYSRVEAGLTNNVKYATYDHIVNGGGYELKDTNAKDPDRSDNIQTWDELVTSDGKLNYLAKESTPYVQYIVDAEYAGTYYLNVGYQFGGTATEGMDYTTFAVIVNDDVYKVEQKTSSGNVWANQTLDIELKEGRNVIRTTYLLKDSDWYNARAWLNHDYISIGLHAQFIPVSETTVNGVDENYVLSNVFTDNGNKLGGLNGTTAGPVRTDMPTIDMLPYAADLIERWPFASVKVTAEKDGFYDITVNAGINTGAASFQLGMLVDGVSYSKSFKNISTAGIDTSVYLTAGEHVITFLIPMPENVYDAREANGTYYPWMDYNSIIFGTGLTVQDAPTINDIKAHLGTTISAGDELLLVNKFNEVSAGNDDKIRHEKYASPDSGILKDKNITLENVVDLGYDKLPYIAYEVNVEKAGTYEVGAIVKTQSGTPSQMGLIIDGTPVKGIPLAATAKEEFVSASVELSKGTHTIMLTCAMPKDSTSTVDYPRFDVFELCISNGATIGNIHAKDTNVTVEMENTTYVSGGTETTYAGASSGKVVGTEINSSEKLAEVLKLDGKKLLQIDWGQMSYAEFATTGTAEEPEIQLKVIATCTPDKKEAGKEPEVCVYVNGEVYKKQLDAWNTFETITIKADLVKGINEFKCFAVADDASADTSVFFDTLYFDTTELTAVSLEDVAKTKTEIKFFDTEKVFTHKFNTINETQIADPVAGDMRYRKYYIDALNINQLTNVPYAAIKVSAANSGYYDISIAAGPNTGASADKIAMLVDGKAYTLSYQKTSNTTLSTMVYLEKGTHMLIFTSPMPETNDVFKDGEGNEIDWKNLKTWYPWFNMYTITLDEGLTLKTNKDGSIDKPGYGDVDFSEVIDSVDTIIDAGDETHVLPDNYKDNGAILEDAARNELKNDRVSLETLLLHGFDKAPYASFKVYAPADGTYHIYALVATDAKLTSDQIAFIVDRMQVDAVAVEKKADNQIIHARVELTKGTHSIIFTAPMPATDEEAQAIPAGETDNWAGLNGKYRWMNYIRFGIDKDLTLVSGLTPTIINGIEAEDFEYVKYHGNYEAQIYPGATGNHAVNGKDTAMVPDVINKEALFHDWSKLSFIEFAVDAQSAGTQNITLRVIATNADNYTAGMVPVLMVYANGKWQEVSLEKWNTFEEVTVSIDLIKGKNIIRCVPVAAEEVAGTRVIFDYIEYDTSALTAVKAEDFATGSTTYNAGDEDKFLTNYYTDKGDTLGDASRNPLKEAKHYIDALTINKLSVVPYAAIKVNAEADGFYDINMEAGANTGAKSSQIALLVDGKAFALSFPLKSETTLSATIYLTQGTHMLVFTSPMPVDSETAAAAGEYDNSAYPWFNMNSFTFSKGLTFVEKPSVAEIDFAEVLGDVDGVINAGDETIVLPNHYTDGGDTLGSADANELKNNRVSVETLLLKGFDKAPFTSFNVTASEDGIYDIYALVQTDAKLTSGQIVVLVDRTQILTVPVEAVGGNQMLHAQIPLTEGTHNLIFTSPMPATDEEAQAIPDGDSDGWAGMNGAYRWMNYIRFAIDKDLTVETGILDSKTEGIESENSVHMDYTGGYQEIVFPGASTGKVLGGDDVINLVSKLPEDADYYDWGQLSYIEMAVDADKAGKYEFTFNVIATQIAQATVFARTRAVDNTLPKVVVYANGKLYEKTISSWDEFEKITMEVDLVKGANVVRVFTVADEIKEGDRVFFDYVEYNRTALAYVTVEEVKESQTIVKAGDETKVLFGHYTDKGDTLASASLGDLQWDKLSLDVLTYDHLNRIPYAAIKVTAEENGYYDVVLTLSAYNADLKSTQIGLLVDAKQKYVLSFEKTKYPEIHASIYLTKGTHTLVFTTPMPADKETAAAAEKFDKLAYPWVDMSTITLSEGLKVVGRPTVDEIETPFYNRVEAENGEYVLYNNYEPTPEASKNASNGYVIGGQMRWIFEQTFEELTAWLDAKHNSYIEYAIMAPADGEYNIRLGFLAGAKDESVAKPYIAVIVNGTTHKVQYKENWGNIQKEELTITLKEGLNIIRCTSYTIEQEGYEGKAWINHDFLDIDKRLMAVKRSSVKVEAEDSAYFNKFTVQDGEDYEKASGKVLGKADRKYISAFKMTLDQISPENIKQIPYASFTVEAPANGYYAMSLDMATDGRLNRGTIGVLVDGQMNVVKYARTGKSTADGRADMLIYLTKGEHVLTFTTPMPADSSVEFNYSYNMANFDSLTLYDGLKLAKTQKAPTTEADYTRLEVEEHVMFNLNSNNGTAAGNAYYKVSQSVAEMFRDGIDGTRTPYVEFTIRASEAGTYTLYTGVSYGMTEGCTRDENEATFVVDTNGKLQTKTVQATKKSTWSIVPVTVNLEKGTNKVRMTHLGSDSQCGGTTWIDFDYIEMSESTAAKLNFAKTGITLEAEEGVFVGYNTESGEGYHNGQYIGSADYGYVDENDVTFENLKPDDLDEMPHVTYNFEVEKAGTYTLSIGFASGLYHHLTAEMAEGRTGGFAVIVNGTSKQLVEFELTTANSHLSRNITVDLVEGENEITVTTTLADYIIAHTPRDDEKYRLIWIDHDYMVLSEGLSRGKEPEKYGLEDSDYNHAQITLKTDAGDKDDNVGDDATNKPGGFLGIVGDTIKDVIQNISENIPAPVLAGIGVAIAAAVGAIIVFIRKKFKKTKNIEESSK